MRYQSYLKRKMAIAQGVPVPYDKSDMHGSLFPFQKDLTEWALRRGRAAMFADTGLGKTIMQLEWARHVSNHGRVLILAPLAVAEQTVAEGERFGINLRYMRHDDGEERIVITNYEMLKHFRPADFVGIVLDESSILKAYDGKTRTMIIEAFAATPWRLACTATPAPNDFTELGNHSQFLSIKTRAEMLSEFFVHDGSSTQDWRVKGHAYGAFWEWVASWGAVVKRPSDLDYSDDGFILPALDFQEHEIAADHTKAGEIGLLFIPPAMSLSDQRKVRRATMSNRVKIAAELAQGDEPMLVWCELNAESAAATAAIPDAIEVKGSDSPEVKTERLLGFASGKYRVLVTKASIAGFGMNWQHCNRMVFLGPSHSYEQTYQAIRRCWRFGQERPVDVHVIRHESEAAVLKNYQRKEADAQRLSEEMAAHVSASLRAEIAGSRRQWDDYRPTQPIEFPEWIGREDNGSDSADNIEAVRSVSG